MSSSKWAGTLLRSGACWLQGCHGSRAQRKALKQVGQHVQQVAGNRVPHRDATFSEWQQELLLLTISSLSYMQQLDDQTRLYKLLGVQCPHSQG